jgi:glycerol uptake facilitator-like aquaporin
LVGRHCMPRHSQPISKSREDNDSDPNLFKGGKENILSARSREGIKVFFASGESQKKTDISKVNHQAVIETEARFKKIMSSKKSSSRSSPGTTSESMRSKSSASTLGSMAKAINKRLGLTAFFCEMLGSFLVEVFACLSKRPEDSFIMVSLLMGVFNLVFQDVSGAQFHPYLTVARWFVSTNNRWALMIQENKVHKRAIVSNWISGSFVLVAQFVGTITGTFVAFAVRGLLPAQEPPDATAWIVFVVELICFFCIVLVHVSTNKTLYLFRPFYIALIWYAMGYVSTPYSGAILNPYRWISISIVSEKPHWAFAWAYILAPLAGMLSALQLFGLFKL